MRVERMDDKKVQMRVGKKVELKADWTVEQRAE